MACVVEHADALLAFECGVDFADAFAHLGFGAVAYFYDCKAQAAQGVAHGFGVVAGVGQCCCACVGCITYDQGYAQVARGLGLAVGEGCQQTRRCGAGHRQASQAWGYRQRFEEMEGFHLLYLS